MLRQQAVNNRSNLIIKKIKGGTCTFFKDIDIALQEIYSQKNYHLLFQRLEFYRHHLNPPSFYNLVEAIQRYIRDNSFKDIFIQRSTRRNELWNKIDNQITKLLIVAKENLPEATSESWLDYYRNNLLTFTSHFMSRIYQRTSFSKLIRFVSFTQLSIASANRVSTTFVAQDSCAINTTQLISSLSFKPIPESYIDIPLPIKTGPSIGENIKDTQPKDTEITYTHMMFNALNAIKLKKDFSLFVKTGKLIKKDFPIFPVLQLTIRNLIQDGNTAINTGYYELAKKIFEAILQIEPETEKARIGLHAVNYLTNPNNLLTNVEKRAMVFSLDNQTDKSNIPHLFLANIDQKLYEDKKQIKINHIRDTKIPNEIEKFSARAKSHIDKKEYLKAIADLEKVVLILKNAKDPYFNKIAASTYGTLSLINVLVGNSYIENNMEKTAVTYYHAAVNYHQISDQLIPMLSQDKYIDLVERILMLDSNIPIAIRVDYELKFFHAVRNNYKENIANDKNLKIYHKLITRANNDELWRRILKERYYQTSIDKNSTFILDNYQRWQALIKRGDYTRAKMHEEIICAELRWFGKYPSEYISLAEHMKTQTDLVTLQKIELLSSAFFKGILFAISTSLSLYSVIKLFRAYNNKHINTPSEVKPVQKSRFTLLRERLALERTKIIEEEAKAKANTPDKVIKNDTKNNSFKRSKKNKGYRVARKIYLETLSSKKTVLPQKKSTKKTLLVIDNKIEPNLKTHITEKLFEQELGETSQTQSENILKQPNITSEITLDNTDQNSYQMPIDEKSLIISTLHQENILHEALENAKSDSLKIDTDEANLFRLEVTDNNHMIETHEIATITSDPVNNDDEPEGILVADLVCKPLSNYSISDEDFPSQLKSIMQFLHEQKCDFGFVGTFAQLILQKKRILDYTSIDIDIVVFNFTFYKLQDLFLNNHRLSADGQSISLTFSHLNIDVANISYDIKQQKILEAILSNAYQRDLSINSIVILWSRNQVVFPLNSYLHWESKQLCAIGNPYENFKSDPKRKLRCILKHEQLGFSIEDNTKAALYSDSSEGMNLDDKSAFGFFIALDKFFVRLGIKLALKHLTEYRWLENFRLSQEQRFTIYKKLDINFNKENIFLLENMRGKFAPFAIHQAINQLIINGNIDDVIYLLENDASLDKQDAYGSLPLDLLINWNIAHDKNVPRSLLPKTNLSEELFRDVKIRECMIYFIFAGARASNSLEKQSQHRQSFWYHQPRIASLEESTMQNRDLMRSEMRAG